jgi:hypothetical protein
MNPSRNVGTMAGDADPGPHPLRLLDHVEVGHLGPARVRPDQGGEDAHRRGLADYGTD